MKNMFGKMKITTAIVSMLLCASVSPAISAQTNDQASRGASASAVASAVIRKSIGVRQQKLDYQRLSENYVQPQRTVQSCPEARQDQKCQLIMMEMQ